MTEKRITEVRLSHVYRWPSNLHSLHARLPETLKGVILETLNYLQRVECFKCNTPAPVPFLQNRDNHTITAQLSTEKLIDVCEAFQ